MGGAGSSRVRLRSVGSAGLPRSDGQVPILALYTTAAIGETLFYALRHDERGTPDRVIDMVCRRPQLLYGRMIMVRVEAN